MDKLLDSRRQKQELAEKIGSISPEKYGKGAYCDLSYTPSKLADNVLFRQASNMKKLEEESSKCREYEAQNQILTDQVVYLKKERDGISASLNEIITMYKGIIAEMEAKSDDRIKESQRKWNTQIQRYIKDKEEEARYFQSEKQLLQEKIQSLQAEVEELKGELAETLSHKSSAESDLDLLRAEHRHLQQKQAATQQKAQEDAARSKAQIEELRKEAMIVEVEWKNRLNEELHKKELEIQSINRSHKADFQKMEAVRKSETLLKNQQVLELTKTFEMESNRLKDILAVKDRMIENLSVENNRQKNRILKMTQDYETEINHLTHEKNRLIDQLEYLGKDNEILAKDKVMMTSDLDKENSNLRDLLMESSVELERCKKEFLSLAKENSVLLEKLKASEEETRTWRDSYYLNKTRAY